MGDNIQSNIKVKPKTGQTAGIKTTSEINKSAIENVEKQSSEYFSTKAYDTLKSGINTVTKNNSSDAEVKGKGKTESSLKAINKIVSSKLESELSNKEDLGSQSAGMGIKTANTASQAFKTSQVISDASYDTTKRAFGTLYKTCKGTYQVGVTGGFSVVTVAKTVTKIKESGLSPISPEAAKILKEHSVASGLAGTELSQKIIYSVNNLHTRINSAIHTASQVSKGIRTGYRIVKGVLKGKVSLKISGKNVSRYVRKIISKSLVSVNGNVYKIAKSSAKITPGINYGINGISSALSHSDDYAIQGTGTAIKTAKVGIQTAVKVAKGSSYAVKTTIKTGKKAVNAGKFIKSRGLRAAWNAGRGHTVKSAQNFLKTIINSLKALGKRVIVPILIIAVAVMACSSVITIPVTAIASIFGSIFNTKDTNTDYDIRDYLNSCIPELVNKFQDDLAKRMEKSLEDHHIVRFYSNVGSDDVIEPTLSGIKSIFPSNDDINNMMQPVFNAVVLMRYELEPTEKEAKELVHEIFSKLFTVSTKESTEYCGQDLKTGKGTPRASHICGSIHAKKNCPNKITGKHSDYACDKCCSYYCPGHTTEGGGTSYCDGCTHTCSGYSYCGSHSVISYTLSVDGIYRLEAEYFLNPIEALSNKTNLTKEEKSSLSQLKDYHEIFKEIMTQTSSSYGGGMKMSDLSGVKFTDGKRKKNQAVIDLALSQVGQAGGRPYWSHYGFASRVEWCACFVNWCMRNTPSATGKYQKTENNAYCQTVANNFKKIGQWGDRNCTEIVAGDTIFFDWNGDGHTDHIGLVIGSDGNKVYTVEGNSGDAVRVNSYPAGSSVIYGYGLMNY